MTEDQQYEQFKVQFQGLTGFNLNLYKENQMKRRIGTYYRRYKCEDYCEFIQLLSTDHDRLDHFCNYITINVTEFFRDPAYWETLEADVLPYLLGRTDQAITAWSCACATGEEPYSLALALARHLPLERFRVIGTDINENVLDHAKRGIYPLSQLEQIPPAYRHPHVEVGQDSFTFTPELKSRVTLQRLNLLQDPYPRSCHLVLCRNVLIYFTPEAKDHVFHGFAQCMASDGCLFLGRAERITDWKKSAFRRGPSAGFCYLG